MPSAREPSKKLAYLQHFFPHNKLPAITHFTAWTDLTGFFFLKMHNS